MASKKLSGLLLGCMLACAFIIMAAGTGYGKSVVTDVLQCVPSHPCQPDPSGRMV